MTLIVRFRPSADADLKALYFYIADQAGPARAWTYIQRLHNACLRLETMPYRGRARDDLAPGIRTINFEGRAIIAYRVDDASVRIVRVLYAGKDYSSEEFPD